MTEDCQYRESLTPVGVHSGADVPEHGTRYGRWLEMAVLLLCILVSHSPILYGHFVLARAGHDQHFPARVIVLPLMSLTLLIGCVRILQLTSLFDPVDRIQWVGKGKWRDTAFGIGLWSIGFIIALALFGMQNLLGIPIEKVPGVYAEQWGNVLVVAYVVRFVVLTPIAEEIFWRVHIQSRLCRLLGSVAGILLQALVFAGMHFYGPVSTIGVFVFAVILGIWRHRKRTLLPLIVAHAIWNVVAVIPPVNNEFHARQFIRSVHECGVFLEEACRPADYYDSAR